MDFGKIALAGGTLLSGIGAMFGAQQPKAATTGVNTGPSSAPGAMVGGVPVMLLVLGGLALLMLQGKR